MKAMFMAGDVVGSSDEIIPVRVWCSHLLWGYDGRVFGSTWAGNVFAEDQDDLDVIAGDFRTAFAVPIVVDGGALSWKDSIHPSTYGKIVAWIAQNLIHELPPNERRPAHIARHIMAQLTGEPDIDVLNHLRVRWQ
jgi:hypothetical protein